MNCLLGLDDDGVVGGMGGDFWLMGLVSLWVFVMGMAQQKNVMACYPLCQKLELKSKKYNSVLEPNTNFREI